MGDGSAMFSMPIPWLQKIEAGKNLNQFEIFKLIVIIMV
jgi:hypothetical protein